MGVSKRSVLWLVLAINIVILAYAMITAGGTNAQPLRLTAIPSPEGTVEGFFRALSQRDFKTADEYISNYRTLGLSDSLTSGSDALSGYIYEHIFDSYSVSPLPGAQDDPTSNGTSGAAASPSDAWRGMTVIPESEYKITGSRASVTVGYTCLDTEKVAERLTGLLRDIGQRTAAAGIAVDNDGKALELFRESVDILETEDVRGFYTRTAIGIELVYTDGRWKIVLTPELSDALCGKFPQDKQETSSSDAGIAENINTETDGQQTEENGNE